MASLQAPLTIIGGGQPFQPPAATWFDEDPLHFVALLQKAGSVTNEGGGDGSSICHASIISGVGSITTRVSQEGDDSDPSSKKGVSEIVRYQAFGLPKGNSKQDNSTLKPSSAFDAAKKAAQDTLKTLSVEISVAFPLPMQLATMEITKMDTSVVSEDDEMTESTSATEPTVMISRRIPILAKFSPKMGNGTRFLALQYTQTMIRIATVEGDINNEATASTTKVGRRLSGGHASSDSHWTIDLSYDANPVGSKPEDLPTFRGRAWRVEEGVVPGSTSIIGGGVLWCARGEALDLIVVTTTSVLVYNMNFARKLLVKMQVLPHELAASFWYEPTTRTLVVGSYRVNDGAAVRNTVDKLVGNDDDASVEDSIMGHDISHEEFSKKKRSSFPSAVMAMKTLFCSEDTSSVVEFPTFAVGTLREVVPDIHEEEDQHELMLSLDTMDSSDKTQPKGNSEKVVVLPSEIFLVNLHGDVYCVELGSLGSGQGIGLTKLDKEAGCIHVRQLNFDLLKGQKSTIESTISVGVIDNLLCIFSKNDETTNFLDVADIFKDDQRVFREFIERIDPAIFNDRLSFLAPSYFLDTSGQGLLYEVFLSLSLLLESVTPTACIIPFLLRRKIPRCIIRAHIMKRFSALIEERDLSTLRKWLAVIVDQYMTSEPAVKFDFESTVSLLSKASLLSLDGIIDPDDDTVTDHIMVPASCGTVLTQTEILQMILLPHAASAIKKGDLRKLKFISTLSVHYLIELERGFAMPSVALQCFVIALLWRTGESAELSSFLSARQSQWTITRRRRQMNLLAANRMYFDDPGATAYAETLFLIATKESRDKASILCSPSTKRQLISYATIILVGCGATSLAVKCLLSAGQLNDAINVCAKKNRANKSAEEIKYADGNQATYFFRVAITNASQLSGVSERCQSFYHLHCFLKEWDPSAFAMESRRIKVSRQSFSNTKMVEQSVIAHECPRFPDELFGGSESYQCQKVRRMFGYAPTQQTQRKVDNNNLTYVPRKQRGR